MRVPLTASLSALQLDHISWHLKKTKICHNSTEISLKMNIIHFYDFVIKIKNEINKVCNRI